MWQTCSPMQNVGGNGVSYGSYQYSHQGTQQQHLAKEKEKITLKL